MGKIPCDKKSPTIKPNSLEISGVSRNKFWEGGWGQTLAHEARPGPGTGKF